MTITLYTFTLTISLLHVLAGLAAWLCERLAREG